MVGERISELLSGSSINNLLSGDFSSLVAIFYLVISLAIYSILIWHFYRFVACRDCFRMNMARYPKFSGFLKYFFVFPFIGFLFFMGFSLMLIFLTKSYGYEDLLSTAFAIVVAIRITSYYSEDLSKDLAKMLPFALLGVVLVNPSYFNVGNIYDKIIGMPDYIMTGLQFIVFIVLIEWIFRIILCIKHAVFHQTYCVSIKQNSGY